MFNFIHIPRAGGSSLYSMVGGSNSIAYCGHIRAVDISSFCFVRNPYERLISAYFYLRNGGGKVEPDITYQEIINRYNNFSDFVLSINKDNLLYEIIHIMPMSHFICDDLGNIVVKKIFKIEEPEKIDEFLAELNIGSRFTETKINMSRHGNYKKYLTHRIIEEINLLYELDFELFEYDKL